MKKIIKKFIPKSVLKKIKKAAVNELISNYSSTNCNYVLSYTDKLELEGKVAIVTGGSGAIGSAISFRLASLGAKVYVCGRNEKSLNEVVKQITDNKLFGIPVIMDVTNIKNIEEQVKTIYEENGHIDILVNNAGGGPRDRMKKFDEQDMEVIDDIINSNLKGTINCARAVIPYMKKQKSGKIINIGSTIGTAGMQKYGEYGIAKAGVINLTKTLAMELGSYNINVNCVSPGKINQIKFDKIIEDVSTNTNYLGRNGKTDDIAHTVAFFATDKSSFITGQNINVDGGRSLGLKGE